jgi:hypothetical protein
VRTYGFTLAGACLLLFSSPFMSAQTSTPQSFGHTREVGVDKDPVAILELGAASSWNFSGGATTFAPNLAAEVTPISCSRSRGRCRRKPSLCSAPVPNGFIGGRRGMVSNSVAGELAGDFIFWPTGKHRFGWYLEPAYDYSFAASHQQSIGMSAGPLDRNSVSMFRHRAKESISGVSLGIGDCQLRVHD